MGLSKGPDWKDDSFGYINTDLADDNIVSFFYEESGYVDNDIFKKIFLAEPLDDKISTILHDNLWDLYEEIFVPDLVDNKINTCERENIVEVV